MCLVALLSCASFLLPSFFLQPATVPGCLLLLPTCLSNTMPGITTFSANLPVLYLPKHIPNSSCQCPSSPVLIFLPKQLPAYAPFPGTLLLSDNVIYLLPGLGSTLPQQSSPLTYLCLPLIIPFPPPFYLPMPTTTYTHKPASHVPTLFYLCHFPSLRFQSLVLWTFIAAKFTCPTWRHSSYCG